MGIRTILGFVLAASTLYCADWSPRLAADYLDGRQKEWFAFKRAAAPGGPCISCHTGTSYLFARPLLRKALGETGATTYEDGLRAGLRARLDKREPAGSQSVGVESVHAALSLIMESPKMNADTEKAFDRMWALQIRDGENKGAWAWFDLKQDPWEMPESRFYGATLAALATGSTPAEYRHRPAVAERIEDLVGYLRREAPSQSMHNRVMLLWASTRLPEVLPSDARKPLMEEILRKQQADGGWTMESLGPWKEHAEAPASPGSNSYATGLVTYVLEQAGVAPKRMSSAIVWLKSHQDPKAGYWDANSMNRKYEEGSMPLQFMRDAATAFATLALLSE